MIRVKRKKKGKKKGERKTGRRALSIEVIEVT